MLVFSLLGLAGWGLSRQLGHLADDLPRYRGNILTKIADVRGAGRGSSVEKLQETLGEIKTGLEQGQPASGTVAQPVVVTSGQVAGFSGFAWLSPLVAPLGTAGLVLTLVIYLLIHNFIAQPFEVDQNSMMPTIQPREYVLIDKLSPRFSDYRRGEVVVFQPPADYQQGGIPFIKRVIGLPGDTVEMRNGRLILNGRPVPSQVRSFPPNS